MTFVKSPLIVVILCSLTIVRVFAGEIPDTEAASHVGETVTIRGTVSEYKDFPRAVFLDLDGRYPNETLSIVCFSKAMAAQLSAFQGKSIAVTGTITIYKGKPEIILKSISQISQ
jgi:DNA/RNA endonuclease YhcR with UshA esterase domain